MLRRCGVHCALVRCLGIIVLGGVSSGSGCLGTLLAFARAPEATSQIIAERAAYSTASSVTGVDVGALVDLESQISQIDTVIKQYPDAVNRPELEAMRADLVARAEMEMGEQRDLGSAKYASVGLARRSSPRSSRCPA